MFKKLEVPVLGVVENMSEFVCPHCGKPSRLFGQGGAKTLVERFQILDLGSIPLDPLVCESGENGRPIVLSHPQSPAAAAFRLVARRVKAQMQ